MATQDLPKCVKEAPTLQIVSSGFQMGVSKDWEEVANKYSHDPVRRFFLYNGRASERVAVSQTRKMTAWHCGVIGWTQFKKHINRYWFWESDLLQ